MLESDFGIRFAPPEIAARFAYERARPTAPTFGFHGLFNFPKAMPAHDWTTWTRTVSDACLASADANDLILELARRGDRRNAIRLLRRQSHLPRRTRRSMRSRLRLLAALSGA